MIQAPPRGHAGRLAHVCTFGVAALLVSCGGTSWHDEPHGSEIHLELEQLSARAPSSTATYFGDEFALQQAALRNRPDETPVQAF